MPLPSDLEMDGSFHSLVDQDEVRYKVLNDFNKIFGSNIENLKKAPALVEELTKKKHLLEQQLMFAATEAPDKISKAVQAAEKSLRQEKELVRQSSELVEKVNSHDEKVRPLLELITPGVNQVQDLVCVQSYQRWSSSVQDISSTIETASSSGDEKLALSKYGELKELVEAIKTSDCNNLKRYTVKLLLHWHTVLYHKLNKDLETILRTIKWPFTNSMPHDSPSLEDHLHKLATLITHFLHLQLPDHLKQSEDTNEDPPPAIVADFPELLPPLRILFRHFELRFYYHFSGNKATNCRDNPEWYFTQALQWISLHDAFLDTWIQPVINKTRFKNITAKIELMRTFVRLITLKLSSDLPKVESDDDLFCRTIQETLNFERELRLGHNYPSNQPSVLTVLTQAHNFARWILIERKCALELMDEIVSAPDAWYSIEGGEAAHCGEQLILLLQGITDRYKPLPQPGHRLQFLELQLELVEDFRVRAVQLMKEEMNEPLTSNYGAILNTIHHLANTLSHWDNIPFFIEMQYYREQFSQLQSQHSATMISCHSTISPDHTIESSMMNQPRTPDHSRQAVFDSLNQHPSLSSSLQLTEVSGSVFDECHRLYLHLQRDMTHTMCTHLATEIRARSQVYRKDRWFADTRDGEPRLTVTGVSPSFCPMLEVLTRNLGTLRDVLAFSLFTELWHSVAAALNKFIYEEVILQNHFSEYGANQLRFDMHQALFPIFGEFTTKPENYFKLVKESVILLCLPRPTAQLLRETLKLGRQDSDTMSLSVSPVKALMEHAVTLLSPEEADTVLNIRTNMANI